MNTAVRMINDYSFSFRTVTVLNLGSIPHYFHFICNIFIQHRVAIIKLGILHTIYRNKIDLEIIPK